MKNILSIVLLAIASSAAFAQAHQNQLNEFVDDQGALYTGTVQTLHANGMVEKEFEIAAGISEGFFKRYDEQGHLIEIGQYEQGHKSGVWKQYHVNGIQAGEAQYKSGLKDGIWTVWDDHGTKRYHMVYSAGKKIDVWKMYDEHGTLTNEMAMEDSE